MSNDWQLAQINVGRIRYPQDDSRMSGFMTRLDEINALADETPGFVWRLQSDSGNATDIEVSEDPQFIINMSVWKSVEALFAFVYKTAHRNILIQRRDWFEKPTALYQALWWIPKGHIPTPEEGLSRLALLNESGPSERAFNFKSNFPHPDEDGGPRDLRPEPYCSGWK